MVFRSPLLSPLFRSLSNSRVDSHSHSCSFNKHSLLGADNEIEVAVESGGAHLSACPGKKVVLKENYSWGFRWIKPCGSYPQSQAHRCDNRCQSFVKERERNACVLRVSLLSSPKQLVTSFARERSGNCMLQEKHLRCNWYCCRRKKCYFHNFTNYIIIIL